MIYLKRIFESDKGSIDDLKEDITDCFLEFIDESSDINTPMFRINDKSNKIHLYINEKGIDPKLGFTGEFSKFYEAKKKVMDRLDSVKNCLYRFKKVRPDIVVRFHYESVNKYFEFIFSLNNNISGKYYEIDGDTVHLDVIKIREMLNIPKSVQLFLGSSLTIEFNSESQMDKYEKDIIEIMLSLKISDDNLVSTYISSYGTEYDKYEINRNRKRQIIGNGRRYDEVYNSIEFRLNQKYEYDV